MNIWYPTPGKSAEKCPELFKRLWSDFYFPRAISGIQLLKPHQETLEFSGGTPFNVIRLVLVIVGAVAASDLRASELDGLVVMRHAVGGKSSAVE